ncbi:hypothetical protein [Paractinoplanes brasiliensis]|uniref:Uncharacterized protein n=1 Tax=Paractinoplanes brasiliensis TaxID=52695 RepID=A0A4R6JU60_9ACTN|nr:hypothetical protein [Actinoplanes brasiliensis]TDO38185.1 hypothetical protein C8E87_1832 [Actinoplanes brasiliensis]GID33164.1 hypothetical protein Abr02nite_81470 [Actinoplanes brasiliensis]
MGEPERRRRRLRPPSGNATPAAPPTADETAVPAAGSALSEAIDDPAEAPPAPAAPPAPVARPARNGGRRPPSGNGDDREAERGLRGLVGSGSSQVSVGAALRARDAARPTDQDLADADTNLAIVRRNWVPREDLPRNR